MGRENHDAILSAESRKLIGKPAGFAKDRAEAKHMLLKEGFADKIPEGAGTMRGRLFY